METGARQRILRIDTKKNHDPQKKKVIPRFRKLKPFALLKTVLMCAWEAEVGVSGD